MMNVPKEASIIITYRCNAKCYMCNTWKNPSDMKTEIGLEVVNRLPNNMKFINITGGEPFIREDLGSIVEVALRKTQRLVVSTNGYYTERILELARRFPDIGVRVSLEGLPEANDRLRGIKGGFDHGLRTLLELRSLALRDVGFGITVSDLNAADMIELYRLAESMGMEFATASTHNSFYFHKWDNTFENAEQVAQAFENLSDELLRTGRVKNWFRAYFNYGMANYVRGGRRLLPCEAGSDMFFVDPCANVMPCNGMDREMPMGNLRDASFEDIWNSDRADKVRKAVRSCEKNCWMIGSVAPAMKKNIVKPAWWILKRKMQASFKRNSSR